MDLIGIEPMTSSMPWKRAPSCATGPRPSGLRYCRWSGVGSQPEAREQPEAGRCLRQQSERALCRRRRSFLRNVSCRIKVTDGQ